MEKGRKHGSLWILGLSDETQWDLRGQWIPMYIRLAFCTIYSLEVASLGQVPLNSSSKWVCDSVAVSVLKATGLLLDTAS